MLILSALFFMLVLATVIGLLLAYSSKKLHVPGDERREALSESLPGLNCGACGFPGCNGYAVALNTGKTEDLTLCPPGGNSVAAALGRIMEQEAGDVADEVAFVKCQGSPDYARTDFDYEGLEDCQAAALLFKGSKSCQYGCIGLGSCVRQCPTDAISISKDSLAVVDPDLCINCRKCIPVCPTKVIRMIPRQAEYGVICNALDHGKVTRSNCKVGCIGCRVCERKHPALQFKIDNNLADVDYKQLSLQTTPPDFTALGEVIKKCPSKCIVPLGSGVRELAKAQTLKESRTETFARQAAE
ncbi:RnfABCDGE type electron transport complex subunit B [Candidatus Haliotispira prima]|uniref:Ion-translocating oxidoreductase complex subunit B n=1 Tax=Candidatus Haliotispira prima TaxID=3034016 RepID=A0ABY8MI86_9SPIO|nr:RnfABCDGE type electron transport complex subunit B [Candidatus Haliotispira prima]